MKFKDCSMCKYNVIDPPSLNKMFCESCGLTTNGPSMYKPTWNTQTTGGTKVSEELKNMQDRAKEMIDPENIKRNLGIAGEEKKSEEKPFFTKEDFMCDDNCPVHGSEICTERYYECQEGRANIKVASILSKLKSLQKENELLKKELREALDIMKSNDLEVEHDTKTCRQCTWIARNEGL